MKRAITLCALTLGLLLPHAVMAQTDAQATAAGEAATLTDTLDADTMVADVPVPADVQHEVFYEPEEHRTSSGPSFLQVFYNLMDDFIDMLIPIFICVVLPIGILFLLLHYRRKREKERSQLIEKMLERGADVTEFIAAEKRPSESKPKYTTITIWGLVLSIGGLFATIGFWWNIRYMGQMIPVALIVLGIGIALIVSVFLLRHFEQNDKTRQATEAARRTNEED